jgi:hypothetical protein
MKPIHYVFLLSVFMASCTDSRSPQATVTSQATITPTPTLTPTFTPTFTPTATLTPTETPDPNKPSDATGRDPSTGEYTKTVKENGKTRVYVWKQFQFGDDAKNGIKGHWFKSWMENGSINLTGYGENCQYAWAGPSDFALNMNIYAVEGQADLDKIGYIFHPDRETEWKEAGLSCGNSSLPFLIMTDLFDRYINVLPGEPGESFYDQYLRERAHYYPDGTPSPEGEQRWLNDHQSFARALTDGSMTIKIGDNDWIPQKGYEVYWINESMAVNDPTMVISLQAHTTKDYYLKVMAKDGKLIAFIAPAKWLKDQLVRPKDKRERIFRSMILFPLEAVITSTYPLENASFLPFQEYQGVTGTISGTIKNKPIYIDIPFIDFTSNQ